MALSPMPQSLREGLFDLSPKAPKPHPRLWEKRGEKYFGALIRGPLDSRLFGPFRAYYIW